MSARLPLWVDLTDLFGPSGLREAVLETSVLVPKKWFSVEQASSRVR